MSDATITIVPDEVAPGLYRLGYAIGTKPMAMYILSGERLTLIDTGLPDTPETVYLPAIAAIGRSPEDVGLIVFTHADADHMGGNHAARELFPTAQLACHRLDKRWISDPAVITCERYDGFREFGLRYEQSVFDMLSSWMGPAEPVDILFSGGEQIRRIDDEWLTIHHVPGHTPGHICLYNPKHRYAIAGDALFGRSQIDTTGAWSAPPPYMSVAWYRETLNTLESFDLDLLLTCHYPVMRGAEIVRFIAESREFVDLAGTFIRGMLKSATAPVTLSTAIDAADLELGPFGFARDLQFALLAHFDHEVEHDRARRIVFENGIIAWESTRK